MIDDVAGLQDRMMAGNVIYPCPNDPPCVHAAFMHDVEDWDDPSPTCCIDGCTCGRKAGA